MNKITDLQDEMREKEEEIKRIKTTLAAILTALPDNPNIKRTAGNCFVLNSRSLGDNWSPEYHDFKRQYFILVQVLEHVKPENYSQALVDIIKKGKIRMPDKSKTLYFHPSVIQNLRQLLNIPDPILGQKER